MYAKPARVRTSRTWLLGVFVLLPLVPGAFGAFMPAWLGIGLGLLSLFAVMAAWAKLPTRHRGAVSADEHGLRLDGRLVARRRSIHSAHVLSSEGAAWLHVETRFAFAETEIRDDDDARALLAALRLDERGLVARYGAMPDRSWSRANLGRRGATLALGLASIAPFLALERGLPWPSSLGGLAAIWAAAFVQLRIFLRSFETVWVGADGIRRRSPAGRARFTPFSRIASVTLERADLVVRLTDGEEIAWHGRWTQPGPVLAAMAERIQRGLEAHRALVASHASSRLARGSRSLERWIDELRAASDPERSSYRVAPIPPDELWKTVESAVAPPTARAGAAVALEHDLDDVGRERLRAVSATCASSALRRALEAVASDESIEPRLALVRD